MPCEGTVRKVMEEINLIHKPKRKPGGITKADREARKSDDLLKRDFMADEPLKKCVTDITEVKAKDGKPLLGCVFPLLIVDTYSTISIAPRITG